VILYQTGRPASLVSFNDAAHLLRSLRWTGSRTGSAQRRTDVGLCQAVC
jgi:hypothetical protein